MTLPFLGEVPGWPEIRAFLKQNRATLLCHHFGVALIVMSLYGWVNWLPSLFLRINEWTVPQFSLWYGIFGGLFGISGLFSNRAPAQALTAINEMTPNQMRGVVTAIYIFVIGIGGADRAGAAVLSREPGAGGLELKQRIQRSGIGPHPITPASNSAIDLTCTKCSWPRN